MARTSMRPMLTRMVGAVGAGSCAVLGWSPGNATAATLGVGTISKLGVGAVSKATYGPMTLGVSCVPCVARCSEVSAAVLRLGAWGNT